MLSGKDVTKLEPMYSVGRNVKMVQPPCERVWWFLKKLKLELTYDPAIPGVFAQRNLKILI